MVAVPHQYSAENHDHFDFERYRQTRHFWDKIEMLCEAVRTMQDWRNLVTHSKPYKIDRTKIENTTDAPLKLHKPFQGKDYVRGVNLENAKKFYLTAVDYTKLLTELTGIKPRASATFVIGEPVASTQA
jgi:hypothetical protein